MAVDQYHMYSNESERGNEAIYYDFKLRKKPLVSKVFIKSVSALGVEVYR